VLSSGSPEGQENHIISLDNRANETLNQRHTIVPQTTIADLCKTYNINHIDYLKMNIEGSGVRALYGLVESKYFPRHVCICCHDFLGNKEMMTYNNVKEWLNNRNYEIKEVNVDVLRPSERFTIFAELSIKTN
jgi:hypothetical protein